MENNQSNLELGKLIREHYKEGLQLLVNEIVNDVDSTIIEILSNENFRVFKQSNKIKTIIGSYRKCTIEEDTIFNCYNWYRYGWVDSKDDGGFSWCGVGASFEDCCDQIDEEYDKFENS